MEGAEARIHNVRRHYRKHNLRRVERLERLLIRSLYMLQRYGIDPNQAYDLITDIREELNRGPEDRLKSAPSRVCREGKAAVAAFQGGEGIDGISAIDSTP